MGPHMDGPGNDFSAGLDRVLQRLEGFLPPQYRTLQGHDRRRLLVLLGGMLIAAVMVALTGAAKFAMGRTMAASVSLGLFASVMLMLRDFWSSADVDRIASRFVVGIFAIALAIAVFTQGIFSGAMMWIAAMPGMYVFFVQDRSPTPLFAASLAALLGFTVADTLGATFYEPMYDVGDGTIVLPNLLGMLVMFTVMASAFRTQRTEAVAAIEAHRDELAAANAHLEQARHDADAANETKSVFLATVSHEIRTPMNAVLGLTEAMLASDAEPSREQLELVHDAGRAMVRMVDDLLDLSRVEAGSIQFEHLPFDLRQTAAESAALFSELASRKGLSLTVSCDVDWVVGDPTRVRQILHNLLGNALKFTSQGGVTVRVTREAGAVRIAVRDTGVGIPPERLEAIFEAFSQAEVSTTRRFGGTGLGLTVCRGLCEAMGGRIEVDSAYGQGSTFTASLPLVDAEPSIDDSEPDEDVGLAGLRLLVVDDHAVNRLVAEKLLGGLGADVVTADSGEEALLGLAPDRYDVILLDVQMPGMSGPETCVAMRAAGVRVPIVALTAGGDARQRAVCLEAGMDEVLTKPLNGATLARHLQALLLAPTA